MATSRFRFSLEGHTIDVRTAWPVLGATLYTLTLSIDSRFGEAMRALRSGPPCWPRWWPTPSCERLDDEAHTVIIIITTILLLLVS